ncbi:MAG TPA: GIY-YIG nuclease family protein [Longimicrobium sp.]|nr:GIY-YIG nuclease family protein [Longimicrobium sp.]
MVLVGASPNPAGAWNRLRIQLKMRGHPNRALQADRKAHREASFTREVLHEQLKLEPARPLAKELEAVERAWLDELQPCGDRG